MKASKFTEAQKAFILKQGEQGTPVAEICRKAGISQATYFNWKKRYGGLLDHHSTICQSGFTKRLPMFTGWGSQRVCGITVR